MAKRLFRQTLLRLGYYLQPVDDSRVTLTMRAALTRRARSKLEVETVVDIGASDGRWSMLAQERYPDAFYLLIEANRVHEQSLRLLKSQGDRTDYVIAAASDRKGEVYFDGSDPFGGHASCAMLTKDYARVPATTVDSEISRRLLRPPFLLKLDTHGYELPILRGAQNTLSQTSLIVIETYNFRLAPGSLTFWEICGHLQRLGFRPIDVVDPLHRPGDQAFWQMDLFFVPATRREFDSTVFR